MDKWSEVVPFLHGEEHDHESRRDEHFNLFGHYPPDDPNEKCDHPMHANIRRAMNGAEFEIPFDPNEIVVEDSEYRRAERERYSKVFVATQEFQREVEARQARERASAMGLILPE